MVTKQWVAIHRKHHRFSDQEGDPHSPHVYGLKRVFFKGAFLYHEASKDKVMVDSYGRGTPADWMELHVYQPYSRLGIGILFVLNTLVFGGWGALIWGIQMIWIPFWAAGVINGVAHWIGYRNGTTRDQSRNISPWGIVVGGEELHNNHHLAPGSARLSRRWWEFDIGWMYIRILGASGLATGYSKQP
jgi:stearoyl-CoA desaturase (delta-9 desaturase)